MDLAKLIFIDSVGDVYMPDVLLELTVVIGLAASFGYKAVNYDDWLHRNDASQHDASVSQLAASATFKGSPRRSPRRHSRSPRGSPGRRSREQIGAPRGVAKGSKKLRLQRIPSHRFNRDAILEMVHVPGAPVIRMSMLGRREASGVPSAEVTFGSPEDCTRVYGVVREPLERDGISVSQV